jgi:hypothetical protein
VAVAEVVPVLFSKIKDSLYSSIKMVCKKNIIIDIDNKGAII